MVSRGDDPPRARGLGGGQPGPGVEAALGSHEQVHHGDDPLVDRAQHARPAGEEGAQADLAARALDLEPPHAGAASSRSPAGSRSPASVKDQSAEGTTTRRSSRPFRSGAKAAET